MRQPSIIPRLSIFLLPVLIVVLSAALARAATTPCSPAIARLEATGRYEFVEPDRLRHLDVTPNDTSFGTQWPLNNIGQNGGIPGADIKATAAWDIIHDAPNVIVAVV